MQAFSPAEQTWRSEMALPEKRNEWNQIDEGSARNRLDDETRRGIGKDRIEEHPPAAGQRHPVGYDFAKDLHPERYPRASLSRLEEGILEDQELRHADAHLGSSAPDLEHRIDEIRGLSRTLLTLGALLLVFAGVLLLWVGWDVRSGNVFFTTMWAVSVVVGLGLLVAGLVERGRIARLMGSMARRAAGQRSTSPRSGDERAA